MTTLDDQATEFEELDRALCLKIRKPEGPAATGRCLNCDGDDELPEGVRWCCPECRNDWQRRNQN